MITVRW